MKLAGGSIRGGLATVMMMAAVSALIGCSSSGAGGSPGGDNGGKKPVAPPKIPLVPTALRFEANVDPERAQALNEAISYLYYSPIQNVDPDLLRILKVNDAKPTTLQAWLEQRVSVIVDENFVLESHLSISPRPYAYENVGDLPQELTEARALRMASADVGSSVIMSNLGGEIYLIGKTYTPAPVLVRVAIDGVGPVDVTSPRTGILQIGEGMFTQLADESFETKKIFHIGTLFHEARHSDGHGASTSFLHVRCPIGHQYEGQSACDRASNGAYTVGALVHKAMMDNCTTCDTVSKYRLRSIYLDFSARVLRGPVTLPATPAKPEKKFDAVPTDYDDAPEGRR